MQAQTAHTVRAKAPIRVEIDWTQADDHALIGGMIANEDRAWLEFLYRFDDILTNRIQATLGRWCRSLRTTDVMEDIKGDIHAYLASRNMRPLRAFDPRHGTLAAWLSRIAHQSAMRRLQELVTVSDEE